MENEEKYCYLTPEFPRKPYLVVVRLTNIITPEKNEDYFPLNRLVTGLDEPMTELKSYETDTLDCADFSLDDICTLFPLKFNSYYPNRKEQWENPTGHFGNIDRYLLFLKAMRHPEHFQILVTALGQYNLWAFYAAIPFSLDVDHRLIEEFSDHYDWPVDERTKYSALYTFGKPVSFNWKTRKILKSYRKINFGGVLSFPLVDGGSGDRKRN